MAGPAWDRHPYPDRLPAASRITPADLAQDLLACAEFHALQLGKWLSRPDVEFITAAVDAITPRTGRHRGGRQ